MLIAVFWEIVHLKEKANMNGNKHAKGNSDEKDLAVES